VFDPNRTVWQELHGHTPQKRKSRHLRLLPRSDQMHAARAPGRDRRRARRRRAGATPRWRYESVARITIVIGSQCRARRARE